MLLKEFDIKEKDIEHIHFIGNTAASEAQMILLSDKARKKAVQLAKKFSTLKSRTNRISRISLAIQ